MTVSDAIEGTMARAPGSGPGRGRSAWTLRRLPAVASCAGVVAAMFGAGAASAQVVEPRGQIYGYSILAESMRDEFPTLRERLGRERHDAFLGGGMAGGGSTQAAVRLDGMRRETDGSVFTDPFTDHNWEQNRAELSIGFDTPVTVGDGVMLLGVSGHVPVSDAHAHGSAPDGADVVALGFGLGVEAAYALGNGAYFDLQGRVSHWETDVDFDPRGISQSLDGLSWGASAEGGKRFVLGGGAVIAPRLLVSYTDVDYDSFIDGDGVAVRKGDTASLLLGTGLLVESPTLDNGLSFYGDLSASWDVLDDTSAIADGDAYQTGLEDVWGTAEIGTALRVGDGVSLYAKGGVGSALDEQFRDAILFTATLGLQVGF